MKNRINSSTMLMLLLICLVFCLTGCGLWSTPLKDISFGELTSIQISVGESVQLAPIITPSTASSSVRYSSDDNAIATVSSTGLLTGVGGGTTKIIASNVMGTIKKELEVVVVYQTIPDGALQLSAQNATQYYGTTLKAVEFTLSWGDIHVPETATIEWYKKVKGESEYTKIANPTTPMVYSLTPPNESGYSATIQVRVSYDDNTYVSNSVIYGVYEEMRDVRISYSAENSGLEYDTEDNTYYSQLGEPFTLTLTWNENANQDPQIKWYIQKESAGAKSEIAGQTSSILTYAIVPSGSQTSASMIDDFTITASADGVFNNVAHNFYLSTEYASVKNATLTASGYTGDKIEMTMLETSEIEFTAGWNHKCTDNSKVVIEYYSAPALLDGETEFNFTLQKTVLATDSDIKFNYSPISAKGTYAVKTIVYNEIESTVFSEAVVEIKILEEYNAVQNLALTVNSGNLEQKNGVYNNVVFKATPTPSNCLNPSAKYEWYVNGVLQSGHDASTFALSSSYFSSHQGETVVRAKLGGVQSKLLTALAFVNASGSESFLNDKFIWNGDEYNHYISSKEELVIAISHIALTRVTNQNFCFDQYSGITFTDTNSFKPYLLEASAGFDESGSRSYTYSYIGSNTIQIGWSDGAPLTSTLTFDSSSPYYDPSTDKSAVQVSGLNAYRSTKSGRETLPIDSVSSTYNVVTSNMLARVVSWGLKPTFNIVSGESPLQKTARENAQAIYNKARLVLLEICDDDMSDLEKVRAIHDWIIDEVQYDYALAGALPSTVDELLQYDGFYLEGIFLKAEGETPKAVCDGKSKAFTLLCGMENISSHRIIGYVNNNPAAGHAWNKVLLDADANGIKNWYVVDTTWGDLYKDGKEYLRHNYFLLAQDEIYNTESCNTNSHTESRTYYPVADEGSFEYFNEINYTVDETMLDGEYMVGFIKFQKAIANSASAMLESSEEQLIEQLAVLLAVTQISGYVEFKMKNDVEFNPNYINDAKIMLTNESGSWAVYQDRGYYMCIYIP